MREYLFFYNLFKLSETFFVLNFLIYYLNILWYFPGILAESCQTLG